MRKNPFFQIFRQDCKVFRQDLKASDEIETFLDKIESPAVAGTSTSTGTITKFKLKIKREKIKIIVNGNNLLIMS